MAPTTRDQKKQKEAEKQNTPDQSNIAISDTSAMLAQIMEMMNKMNGIITRLEALKARSRPATPTPTLIISAQQATQAVTQQATQQATPPTPEQQVFQPSEQEQEQEQEEKTAENNAEKIAENTAESTAKNDSSKPDIKSTLSTIPRQGTMPIFRDPTACPSDALLFACQHTTFLALTWKPPYIEYAKEMEATGQG